MVKIKQRLGAKFQTYLPQTLVPILEFLPPPFRITFVVYHSHLGGVNRGFAQIFFL
jgi:hypothetical protein